MKQCLMLLSILLLCMGNSHAQLNESDTLKFQLRTSLTGNYQQGNVEAITIKSKIDFTISLQENWVIKSQNSSLYQSFYNVEADNDIFSRNYLYYQPKNKIYPFAIGYVSSNYRRKIDSRYFLGAGATWQVINTKKDVLKFSTSAIYEATKFKINSYNYTEYNGDNRIALLRSTFYVGGWNYLFEKHVRLYYDAYWQPSFSNNNNYRTQVDIGADFPIWKGLSFNFLYAYTYENVVIANVKQDDKILTFGLAFNFKTK